MAELRQIRTGLSFDDVLLIPQESKIVPSQTDLASYLTDDLRLSIPLVSAAMDTVTESRLAAALALEGGLGFIHKNMAPESQAEEVRKAKLSGIGLVSAAESSLTADATIGQARKKASGLHVSVLPVIGPDRAFLGFIGLSESENLDDSDIVGKHFARYGQVRLDKAVAPAEAEKLLTAHGLLALPVLKADRTLLGYYCIERLSEAQSRKQAVRDSRGFLRVGAAVGIGADTMKRVSMLVEAGVDAITVDSAHGHSYNVIKTVRDISSAYPGLSLIAGNIVTPEAAEALTEAGADAVKVGIGPGSICTTRIIAGVGVPQLTAIDDVSKYIKEKHKHLIADGGIKYSGDIVKALAAGADTVMLGSLFAMCSEAPGTVRIIDGKMFKSYVGMGSLAAMKRGSADRYFQKKETQAGKLVPEGIEASVPIRGNVADTVYQLCGGLRSGLGYCGAANIAELQEKAQFIRITGSGLRESHPHDVRIDVEAPNYHQEK